MERVIVPHPERKCQDCGRRPWAAQLLSPFGKVCLCGRCADEFLELRETETNKAANLAAKAIPVGKSATPFDKLKKLVNKCHRAWQD